MATYDTYRSNNGKHLFKFAFEYNGSFYYAHILRQSSYRSRIDDLHETHRLSSGYSGATHRICFGDNNNVRTLRAVIKYAEAWSEATVKYIEYGTSF